MSSTYPAPSSQTYGTNPLVAYLDPIVSMVGVANHAFKGGEIEGARHAIGQSHPADLTHGTRVAILGRILQSVSVLFGTAGDELVDVVVTLYLIGPLSQRGSEGGIVPAFVAVYVDDAATENTCRRGPVLYSVYVSKKKKFSSVPACLSRIPTPVTLSVSSYQ